MNNFFKDKCVLIFKTLFLVIFITNLSYARDESSAITWTHLLPEGVFDFIPEGGVTDEMWRDNEFLEKLRNSGLVTVDELDGVRVRITGFMVPLDVDWDQIETVSEFVLVPSPGMCIHVPPPPPNQMVLVQLDDPVQVRSMFEPIGISGKISIKSPNAEAYDSVYVMRAEKVEDVTFDELDLGR